MDTVFVLRIALGLLVVHTSIVSPGVGPLMCTPIRPADGRLNRTVNPFLAVTDSLSSFSVTVKLSISTFNFPQTNNVRKSI